MSGAVAAPQVAPERTGATEGPPAPWLPPGQVGCIVVFRALVLGDLICATPTLRALRGAYPRAHIALVGLPAARALAERLEAVDEFIAFPGHPALPEIAPEPAAWPRFLRRVHRLRPDLALQLHGSGGVVNPMVARFGARHEAMFVAGGAWRPAPERGLAVAWRDTGHEIERLLALTDAMGLPRVRGTALDFPLRPADREALRPLLAAHRLDDGAPYACVHPGAQLPSRRWPAERFAALADGLAARGYRIVLTGTAGEAELVAAVADAMRATPVDLAGRTDLWTLGALIEGAAALVCNDTGVSHVAAAVGTPSVVVSSGADVSRWAPLDRLRHRVLWHALPCRPCSHPVCPYGHECARAITADDALHAVDDLLAAPHAGGKDCGKPVAPPAAPRAASPRSAAGRSARGLPKAGITGGPP